MIKALEAVSEFLTTKLSADDAVEANEADIELRTYDAVVALFDQLAVPNNEPVKLIAVTLPLTLTDPVTMG